MTRPQVASEKASFGGLSVAVRLVNDGVLFGTAGI